MKTGRAEVPFGAENLIIESGKLAKQANGAVTVTCGGTVVLVTACISRSPREGLDFFPLMVEYQEKTYSAGRIPGGFFKREGRPTEKEILTSRLIDRPIRPLFPKGLYHDVQVVASVLSHDGVNDPDVLALNGASAALMVSDIPFEGPLGAVRVGLIDNEFVVNPSYEQREQSLMDMVVVGSKDGIVMVEAGLLEVPEEKVIGGLEFGFKQLQTLLPSQTDLQKQVGNSKTEFPLKFYSQELIDKVRELTAKRLPEIYKIGEKEDREEALNKLLDEVTEDMSPFAEFKYDDRDITPKDIRVVFDEIEYEEIRRMAFKEKRRVDGRGFKDIRQLTCEVNVLPRTHGSALFTRGQTQSLGIVTLGSRTDEQMIESLDGKTYRTFMLHYNFPSFSVGETKPMRGPGRREIGHGALASKSLTAVLPTKEDFPYTIRVVSEILESNGSSSMATVCASSLSLMQAGVPIKEAVAGISIGLISGEKESIILTDIMGAEDHFGDMDFKVAGTKKGITALQLDLKIKNVSMQVLKSAIDQAQGARMTILDKMHEAISAPNQELSEFAPRVVSCTVPTEKIGEIIGPGGKMIKKIIEETGVSNIDIEDDGKVLVLSPDQESAKKAVDFIGLILQAPEVGKTYKAKVKRVMDFGAFCEFLPGKEGLVHVSELSSSFVKDIHKVVKVGDEFNVKLIEIDKMKRVNLSKKQAE